MGPKESSSVFGEDYLTVSLVSSLMAVMCQPLPCDNAKKAYPVRFALTPARIQWQRFASLRRSLRPRCRELSSCLTTRQYESACAGSMGDSTVGETSVITKQASGWMPV